MSLPDESEISANPGGELEELDTDHFGFGGVGRDKKLQLLPTPFPRAALPPSSASLLAVASKRGLIAAAGPDVLVLTSTDGVRETFQAPDNADENNIIRGFAPDLSIATPQLRHVAFSSDEQYLVVSAESAGGLTVYRVDDLLKNNTTPVAEMSTDQTPLRTLAPNPEPAGEFGHQFAAVLDTGRLLLFDVATQEASPLPHENITCVGWSTKGKALIAGVQNGTAILYKTVNGGSVLGLVPLPPNVDPSLGTAAVYWINNEEFFVVHSPFSADDDAAENTYHFVTSDKNRRTFAFRKAPLDIFFASMDMERTRPPRFSVIRLREWEPNVNEMLILACSNSIDVKVLINSSGGLSQDQVAINDFAVTNFTDTRRAELPTSINDDDITDTLPIGEAVDLSSKVKVERPIPTDHEYNYSPGPLPIYLVLNHQGMLAAWWVVHDNSIREGKVYHGLVHRKGAANTSQAMESATPAKPSPFAKSGLDATPKTPNFSSPGFPSVGAAANPFSKAAPPTFGKTSFEQPSKIGWGSAVSQPSQPGGFGQPSQPGTLAGIGKPSQPGAAFGSAPTFGKTSSLWGAAASPSSSGPPNPFSKQASGTSPFASVGGGASPFAAAAQSKPNPFASLSGPSAFSTGGTPGASPFSSVPATGQSAFSGLSAQKSAFSLSKESSAVKSFGSTISVGATDGAASTLNSFGQPGKQTSIFGATGTSSFTSSKESGESRGREETPTPQAPGEKPKDLFGMSGAFQVGSTFKGDGTAKDDLPKPKAPAGGSLFGTDFSATLGGVSNPPETPIKEESESRLKEVSTTPASPPKAQAPSPPESPAVDDAPLPPDFITSKTPQKQDDDLPPLAGSPGVKVEVEDSEAELSEEGDVDEDEDEDEDEFSVEEQESDEGEEEEDEHEEESGEEDEGESEGEDEESEEEEEVATPAASKKKGWLLQDSATNSPLIRPAAPTPPPAGTTSNIFAKVGQSGQTSNIFGKPSTQPKSTSLFGLPSTTPAAKPSSIFPPSATTGQSTSLFGTSTSTIKPSASITKPLFPASTPSTRAKETLRSPSPVRSSASVSGSRSLFGASTREPPKAPEPEPELSSLADDEDERVRRELATIPEPSPALADFISHQNYTGTVTKTGTAAAIERTYRDINSMIDTVGLNARSLESFVLHHSHRGAVSRDDLDHVIAEGPEGPWFDNYSFAQIDDLKDLQAQLESELDAARVTDVLDKLGQLARLHRERARLLTKMNEIRRTIINRRDPERIEAHRKAALPKDLADQQKALRNAYASLLSQLSAAEEAEMLLRSKLASVSANRGNGGAVPSAGAVRRTIEKMIAMTERKNIDILALEGQLRKLHVSTGAGNGSPSTPTRNGTPSRSLRASRAPARNQSPSPATPQTGRSRMSLSELNRVAQTPEPEDTPSKGYGLFYTPEGSVNGDGVDSLRRLNEMGDAATRELVEAGVRRREVAEKVKEAVVGRGVRVTRVVGRIGG